MIDETVRDVLLYLPDWTTEPPTRTEHRRYAKAFTDPDEEEDFQSRRHVTEDEVLTTYNRTRRQAAFYLNRKTLPDIPVIYDYICMWTAGILEEKYQFKEYQSNLVADAKEALKPYIKSSLTNLNRKHHKKHGNCKPYYEYLICDGRDCYKPRPRKHRNTLKVKTRTYKNTLKVNTKPSRNTLTVNTEPSRNTLTVNVETTNDGDDGG